MATALDGNNPGGMNDGAWAKSQPGYAGPNGRYASFRTLTDGVNAMRSLLAGYIRRGFDTPREIAARWAPDGDGGNNSRIYASRIAAGLKITVDTRLLPPDAQNLTLAMAKIENAHFPQAWSGEQVRLAALRTGVRA